MTPQTQQIALAALNAIAGLNIHADAMRQSKKIAEHALTVCAEADRLQPQHSNYCLNCEELSKQVTALKLCVEVERGFKAQELTDGVLVPLTILEAVEESMGSFCSGHASRDMDLQNIAHLSACIARHKAAMGITKGQS